MLAGLAAEPDPPTTVKSAEAAVEVHVADSLSALELEVVLRATRLADIGAGAGFPGLPLAVALPQAEVELIEATRRKCEVIERLASAAGIGNARAVPARAEDWARDAGAGAYDVVTARAVASLAVLAEYAAPLLRLGGSLVAWKGRRDRDEEEAGARGAAELGLEPGAVIRVEPSVGAEQHHLHVYTKVAETPARFPRRPGMARKRPLA